MKLLTTLLITAFMVTSANAQWWGNKKVKGNGNVTTQERKTSDYDEVKVAGSFDVTLVRGTEGTITIKAEENLMEHIITEVDGDELKIKVEKGINLRPSNGKKIEITVPFQDISEVALAGSGDVSTRDKITADSFEAKVAGSGDLVLEVEANDIEAAVAGSGDLTLTGSTNSLEAKVAGSGDFHGFDLNSNDTEVNVAGSGDARVTCKSRLKARVAGSGTIKYKGNPTKEDTKVAGSGSISKS